MRAAPDSIGGARVLKWARIDPRHRATENCRHITAGAWHGPAAGLAVCRHEGEEAVFLFGCDEEWNSVTDSWHETLADALEQAEFEYEGVSEAWNDKPRA